MRTPKKMMMWMRPEVLVAAGALAMLSGCGVSSEHTDHGKARGAGRDRQQVQRDDAGQDADAERAGNPWRGVDQAVCVVLPTEGNVARGVVRFVRESNKVRVTAEISGLTPNGLHAMHIHEWGDMRSGDGMATGDHYNPEGHDHGLPDQDERHAGDFGNLQADEHGNATFELVVDNINIAGRKNPIIGRAVIIHEGPDDGSQPVGNAGPRIAQGVIGIVKPEE